jgi:multidrug efflux pump
VIYLYFDRLGRRFGKREDAQEVEA